MKQQNKWREKIVYFMKDRYGQNDVLNKHILFFCFVSLLVYPFTNAYIFIIISILLLGFSYFRTFSKNKVARKKENDAYLKKLSPIRFQILKFKNRDSYRYLKCPNCKQKIRVPKNKGLIRVSCPKCHHEKEMKT